MFGTYFFFLFCFASPRTSHTYDLEESNPEFFHSLCFSFCLYLPLWIKFCPDFPRSCNLQAETCKQKETITSFCSFGPRSLSHWNQDRLAYLHLCYLPVLKLLVTNSLFRTVEWLFNARQLPRHCCPMNLGYISLGNIILSNWPPRHLYTYRSTYKRRDSKIMAFFLLISLPPRVSA